MIKWNGYKLNLSRRPPGNNNRGPTHPVECMFTRSALDLILKLTTLEGDAAGDADAMATDDMTDVASQTSAYVFTVAGGPRKTPLDTMHMRLTLNDELISDPTPCVSALTTPPCTFTIQTVIQNWIGVKIQLIDGNVTYTLTPEPLLLDRLQAEQATRSFDLPSFTEEAESKWIPSCKYVLRAISPSPSPSPSHKGGLCICDSFSNEDMSVATTEQGWDVRNALVTTTHQTVQNGGTRKSVPVVSIFGSPRVVCRPKQDIWRNPFIVFEKDKLCAFVPPIASRRHVKEATLDPLLKCKVGEGLYYLKKQEDVQNMNRVISAHNNTTDFTANVVILCGGTYVTPSQMTCILTYLDYQIVQTSIPKTTQDGHANATTITVNVVLSLLLAKTVASSDASNPYTDGNDYTIYHRIPSPEQQVRGQPTIYVHAPCYKFPRDRYSRVAVTSSTSESAMASEGDQIRPSKKGPIYENTIIFDMASTIEASEYDLNTIGTLLVKVADAGSALPTFTMYSTGHVPGVVAADDSMTE